MDCQEVAEILDAYALGAAERSEGRGLEEHVGDCLRCWEELNKAQRTAALLALSLPVADAPDHLRERIMRKVASQGWWGRTIPVLLPRLRLARPMVASFAGVAVLGFAAFMQTEMSNLRGDNSALELKVARVDSDLEQARQVEAVLLAGDSQQVPINPASTTSGATGAYHWSAATGIGVIFLTNMPPLTWGSSYQAWFTFGDAAISAGTCFTVGGFCRFEVDLSVMSAPPDAVGISVEPLGGSGEPTGGWVMFAAVQERQQP